MVTFQIEAMTRTSGNILSRGDVNAVNVYASAAITGETLNVTTLSGENGIIENCIYRWLCKQWFAC